MTPMGFQKRLAVLAGAAALVLLAGACGAAEEPTATPTKAPAATPTPTTAALGATPTATRPAVVATPTPAPTATSTPTGPAVKKGGMLRFNSGATPLQLDVLQTTTSADTTHMVPLYDGFFVVEPDRTFSPAQAERWQVSPDFKSITLNLVKGIKFHDGTPFNAQAVKSDLDYKLNPENRFEQLGAMAAIASVDVVDEYSVKLNLKNPDALIMPNLAARPGWVFSPTYRDATPKANRKNKPVGAGHFKFVEILQDSHATYERWPNGFSLGKYPYIDKLQYLYISDPAVQLASYRAGDIDAFSASNVDLPLLRADKRTALAQRWQTEWGFFNVNPRVKPLDNVQVRKAMSQAIDRQALVDVFKAGEGAPLYGVIGPAWPWCYDPSYKKYGYDQAAAKKLLADAGFPNGFTVGPVTWFGKESRLPVMNLLADQMKQVGIILDLRMIESSQASADFRINKKTAAYSSEWGTGAPDIHTVFGDWFTTKTPGWMFEGYLDQAITKELDTALDNGRATLDLNGRCSNYRKAQEIINDNMLGVSLFQGKVYMALRDYVKDFKDFPSGGGSQWFRVWLDN